MERARSEELTYIATVKTALSGPDDAIMKRLSSKHTGGTIAELLTYLIDEKQLKENEIPTASSIRSEMAREYTVAVNGEPAKPTDRVEGLFKTKTHKGVSYQSVELEVASVQQGGLAHVLRYS